MVRTKSMYVVWIVMAAAIFFSTSMSKLDIDTMNKEAEQQQTESIAETVKPETINMGMSVFLPTQPGEKVTVFDQVYANLQAKFVALFLVIFTVLFSSADIGSGYIKNIGGQVRSRRNLIFSKASVLFVYTTVTMLLYFIIQIIAQQMYFGYLEWGNGSELLRYFGIQILLHYALVLISMAIAVVLNSNVFSMTVPVLHPEIISQYFLYLRFYTPYIYIRLQFQFYRTHFCVILKQPTGKLEGSQNVRRVILLLVHRKNKAAGI